MGLEVLGSIAAAAANMWSAKRAGDRNEALQKEFANNGIKMRVEDAKRAGVHPIYALGASLPSATPVRVGQDFSGMGQDITRALASTETAYERELRTLQLQRMRDELKEGDLRRDALNLELAKKWQEFGQSKGMPASVPPGTVQVKPDEQISTRVDDNTITAGQHPAWKRFDMFPGWPGVDLLQSDEGPSESLEGIGALGLAIGRNLVYRPYMHIKESLGKVNRRKFKKSDYRYLE